jgi:hypothetical protein
MAAWKKWLHSSRPSSEWQIPIPHAGVEAVRRQVLSALDDCEGLECDRLRWRLNTAESAQDLWLLRGAIFQLVASQHCQTQAADRINQLLPAFQRVLPSSLVSRV